MKLVVVLACSFLLGCASTESPSDPDAGPGGGGSGGEGGVVGAGGASGAGGAAGDSGNPDPTERRVFVTAMTQAADLDGPDGADATCASEARAAGLEGEFKAWLSTLDVSVADRFVQSTIPYVLVDGTVIADDWTDLTDGTLQAPINLDATGQGRGGDVWTGTLPSAEPYAAGDCEGFTSNSGAIRSLCGSTQFSNNFWTAAQTPTCSTALRLFCFQQ